MRFDATKHPRSVDSGRYVEKRRVEPDVLLDGRPDELTDEELLAAGRHAAHRAAKRWAGAALDTDDLASEAVLAVLENRKRRADSTDGCAVSDLDPIETGVRSWVNERGLARYVAQAAAAKAAVGSATGPDFAGYRKYAEAVEAFAANHLRQPTNAERDEIAAQVRLSFPLSRRPTIGFHRPDHLNRTTLYVTGDDGEHVERTDSSLIISDVTIDAGFDPDSTGERAHTALEQHGGVKGLAEAKRLAYVALAERSGAPLPRERALSEVDVKRFRDDVAAAGGAAVVAQQLLDGSPRTAATVALLAPFGELTPAQQRRVAAQLLEHPTYADHLYQSAVAYATNRRFRSSRPATHRSKETIHA